MKKLIDSVKQNAAECYVGFLLFVGIPAAAGLYFDVRAAIALSLALQAIVGIIYLYRGAK